MRTSNSLLFGLAIMITLLLSSCATQPAPDAFDSPDFFTGFWHGFIILFALVGHLFDSGIRIYNFPNNGGWYDFGFFLGVASFCGGGASSASNQER